MKNIKNFKQFNEEISPEMSNEKMYTYEVTFDVVAGSDTEAEEKLYDLESETIDLGLFKKEKRSSESTILYKVDVTVVASDKLKAEEMISGLESESLSVIDMKYDSLVNKESEVLAESKKNKKFNKK